MANFHYLKIAAVGTEEQVKALLSSMLVNHGESGEIISSCTRPKELYLLVLRRARAEDSNCDFLMKMIAQEPSGGFYADNSFLKFNEFENGLYSVTFEYATKNKFNEADFVELHNNANFIYMYGLQDDEAGADQGSGGFEIDQGEFIETDDNEVVVSTHMGHGPEANLTIDLVARLVRAKRIQLRTKNETEVLGVNLLKEEIKKTAEKLIWKDECGYAIRF